MTGPQLRSPRATVAKSPPRRITEPPLDILLISVWSPSVQIVELPSEVSEGEGRKHLGHEMDEDSLLTNADLAVGAVSFILWDSDLKSADAMSVKVALALSLQGATTACLDTFICSFHRYFKLSINFISFLQMTTYMKSLVRRASFAEGSAKSVKAYKAKFASLTFEKADL